MIPISFPYNGGQPLFPNQVNFSGILLQGHSINIYMLESHHSLALFKIDHLSTILAQRFIYFYERWN